MFGPPWRRSAVRVLWDCFSWIVAALLVVAGRYGFRLDPSHYTAVAVYAAAACVLQLVVGTSMKLYRGRYHTASFDEMFGLTLTVAIVSVMLLFVVASPSSAPASSPERRP